MKPNADSITPSIKYPATGASLPAAPAPTSPQPIVRPGTKTSKGKL